MSKKTQEERYAPPEPGDVRQYGAVEVVCDEDTHRYRAFVLGGTSDELVCETRSWPVVLCKAFGVVPSTVGGQADLEAYNARQFAELKTWTDPDTREERTVRSATIHGYWTVILVLEDGERVELAEEGRVVRRFYMAEPKPEPQPKPEPKPEPEPKPAVVMSAGFTTEPLPADPIRQGEFDGRQGRLF